jgi:hypothetical protein
MIVLTMTSTFEHPDWNLEYCHQKISTFDILGKLAASFENAAIAVSADQNGSGIEHIYTLNAKKMRWIQEFCRMKVDKSTTDIGQTPSREPQPDAAPTTLDEPLNFLDEAWFHDMLGPWEHQGL